MDLNKKLDSVDSRTPTATVSFIVEWANTGHSGEQRCYGMLAILERQWRELLGKKYPAYLDDDTCRFLNSVNWQLEVLIVSGEAVSANSAERIGRCCLPSIQPAVHVREGLEYYALKNWGAELATGEIACFIDSDVHPDEGWLMHLLGTFANPEVRAVSGKAYVAPVDLFSRAFAASWIFEPADRNGTLAYSKIFHTNNFAVRTTLFNQVKFPTFRRRTRGAGTIFHDRLSKLGIPIWENRKALVNHPPPSGWKHLAIRALAHGRDMYMKNSEERSWQGFFYSQRTAASRFLLGINNTFKHWREIGLKRFEIAPAAIIISCYYLIFSLGGLLTHISPRFMGSHFRI